MTETPAGAASGAGPATATATPLISWLPRIHREGWPFVAIAAVLACALALVAPPFGWPALLAPFAVALFFRDPPRMTPVAEHLAIAPADGLITAAGPALPPAELNLGDSPRLRISIFLSVLDVHINRLPVAGTIKAVAYHPGAFVNAARDKASDHNERNSVVIGTAAGDDVVVVQIAGLIARRIRCWVGAGDVAETGRRFGLIRFGSRVDLYLPAAASPLVVPGQRAVGGETVLADLSGREPPCRAERR